MPEATHQLAAIMFTDIVGYTKLMGEDEQRAIRLLDENLSIQKPLIEQHQGKLLKEMGDGLLASFNSAIEAVKCAIEIQDKLKDEPELNISVGIHTGDVLFRDGDILGDGVNIASRIESLASSGEILVSESVYDCIKNQAGIHSEFVKEETLKNVVEPVKIYKVSAENFEQERILDSVTPTTYIRSKTTKPFNKRLAGVVSIGAIIILVLTYFLYNQSEEVIDKSIAVIPFTDMSPEGDHEWFSDGISEELLNALVRIPGLKVVGRTSSWTYKGTNKDLMEIGKELGVGTILEGSVRKAGTTIRITAQLINTADGFHLWSHTYDRELTDIFAVQDEITAAIVDAMRVHLTDESVSLKPTATADFDAYTIYLQARQKLASRGIENLIEARQLFEKSIAIDPNYDPSYSGLGRALSLFPLYSTQFSAREVVGPAKDAANKALELNPQNSEAFSVLGIVATFYEWDWKAAEEAFIKSLELSPDDAEIYNFFGDYYQVVEHPILVIEMESKALELNPLHSINHHNLGQAYALIGDWENALRYAKSAQGLNVLFLGNDLLLVMSYIELGRLEEAENVVAGLDDNNDNYYSNLYIKTFVAISKGESDLALSYIKLMVNEAEKGRSSSRVGQLYLDLGMLEEAAYWLEKAYDNHDLELVLPIYRPGRSTLPENLPDHPALQAALDKPELNALFEIRRKNLKLREELQ